MRMTAPASSGGHSARNSSMAGTGTCTCAYMTDIIEVPGNGSRPVSISYATTPSAYWSEAPLMSLDRHCSGLM